MPAPLSLIVPTLNAQDDLPRLMETAIAGLGAGVLREMIVADGGSVDDTVAVAEAAGARVVTGARGRGAQIGAGIAAARAPWLLVLHVDSALPDGWSEAVSAAMAQPDRAWVFRLAFRAEGFGARRTAAWANLRSRVFGLPYGDQGLLIARDLLAAVGGYPDLPLMEDVALARRLGRARLGHLPATLTTGAERYLAEGWTRRGARNLWTLARYLAGTPPERLIPGYEASARSNCSR